MSSRTIFKKCPTERNRGEKNCPTGRNFALFTANCPTGRKYYWK